MSEGIVVWYTECRSCPKRVEINAPSNWSKEQITAAFAEVGVQISPYICPECLATKNVVAKHG